MKWPVEKKVATGFLAGFVLLGVIRFAAYEINMRPTPGGEQSRQDRDVRLYAITSFTIFTSLEFALLGTAFYFLLRYTHQRRETEQVITRQLAFTQAVCRSLGEGVYVMDTQGQATFLNPAAEQMLGWSESEARGKNVHAMIHHHTPSGEVFREDQCPVLGVAETGRPYFASEDAFWTRDGKMIPVAYAAAPIIVEQQITGVAVVFRDTTEERRVEKEMREAKNAAESASRAKGLFVANMSHELRTPLNAIIGYSEMLMEQPDAVVEQRNADLGKIHQAGKQLLSLINDILDMSKIEAGKMTLRIETFDVASLVRDVMGTLAPIIAQSSNQVSVHCPPGIGPIDADMSKVRQVLFNLLTNALKFTRNGTIQLQVARTPGRNSIDLIVFKIIDTGIGMTAEQLDRLFEPFSQADSSGLSGGTGLGLALSRQFCRMMGGDIAVASDAGKGSTFVVTLPAKSEVASSAGSALPGATDVAPAAQKTAGRVLIIDDDPEVRDLLTRTIQGEGFEVRAAADGKQGIEIAQEWKPTAITLDVLMPEMDGWAVLGALKSEPATAQVPVVMISIIGDDSHTMGIALGASEFITKPVDRKRLARLLNHYRHGASSPTVMLVEDDADTRQMMRRSLESWNWTVIEAANGREALEKLREVTPTTIVLDLMMPEIDGFELVTQLRQNPTWQSIPVVVVTARELSAEDHLKLNGSVRQIVAKNGQNQTELLDQLRRLVEDCRAIAAEEGNAAR